MTTTRGAQKCDLGERGEAKLSGEQAREAKGALGTVLLVCLFFLKPHGLTYASAAVATLAQWHQFTKTLFFSSNTAIVITFENFRVLGFLGAGMLHGVSWRFHCA